MCTPGNEGTRSCKTLRGSRAATAAPRRRAQTPDMTPFIARFDFQRRYFGCMHSCQAAAPRASEGVSVVKQRVGLWGRARQCAARRSTPCRSRHSVKLVAGSPRPKLGAAGQAGGHRLAKHAEADAADVAHVQRAAVAHAGRAALHPRVVRQLQPPSGVWGRGKRHLRGARRCGVWGHDASGPPRVDRAEGERRGGSEALLVPSAPTKGATPAQPL